MFKLLIIVIISLIVLYLAAILLGDIIFQTAKAYRFDLDHEKNGGKQQSFRSGGNQLMGWIYSPLCTPKNETIIISHASGVTSNYYIPEAVAFAQEGYRVFLFDNTQYGESEGHFLGFTQAVKDLKNAIDFLSDGTNKISLFGHSMGAYAACSVIRELDLSRSQINNVISYAGPDELYTTVYEVLEAKNSLFKRILVRIIALSQFLIFGKKSKAKASDSVKSHPDINFILVHGKNDEQINIDTISIFSKAVDAKNVHKICVTEEGSDGHMTVIRQDRNNPVINQRVLSRVMELLT